MAIDNPKGLHHTEHEPGGVDAITTLDGSLIKTGAIPAAQGGTGVTTGLTALSGSNITTGTVPDGRLSANVAMRNAQNTFTAGQLITAATPTLYLTDTAAPTDAKVFRLFANSQLLSFDCVNDGSTIQQSVPLQLNRGGDVKAGRDLYEKGRTTPMGHWIAVPYSAGNFTSDVGTWVVDAGDVATNQYTIIGKTMFWLIYIAASTTTGSPTGLKLALPSGLTIAQGFTGLMGSCNDGVFSVANTTAFQVQASRAPGSPSAAFSNLTNAFFFACCLTIPLV